MKITEMNILEIEEFIRDEFPTANLAIRCLDCGDYLPLNQIDLELEICEDCARDREKDIYYCANCGTEQVDEEFMLCDSCQAEEEDE